MMAYETYTRPEDIRPDTRKHELRQVYVRTNGNRAAVHKANAAFESDEKYRDKGPVKYKTVEQWCDYWDKCK